MPTQPLAHPLYSDLPPSYDTAVARISPLDASLSRTHAFTLVAVLLPYRFVPLWEFPTHISGYVPLSYPALLTGIKECNQTLRLISNRQLWLYICHFFIYSGCVVAFFMAALVQRGSVLEFTNSKIVVPSIAAVVIVLLLSLSHVLRTYIISIKKPIVALEQSVAKMGWAIQKFYPAFGLIVAPEIQITYYES